MLIVGNSSDVRATVSQLRQLMPDVNALGSRLAGLALLAGSLLPSAGLLLSCAGGAAKEGLGPDDQQVDILSVRTSATLVTTDQVVVVSARGFNVAGNAVPVKVGWSASGGAVASVSDSEATFASGSVGDHVVRASVVSAPSVADSVIITVISPPSPTVSISILPSAPTVTAGTTLGFSATAQRQDGSTFIPAVSWEATGGTITAGGLYTAGATAGIYRVIALQQGGTLADTSVVTLVQPPPPGPTTYPHEPAGLFTPYTITAPQPYTFDERPREKGANDGRGTYALDDHGWMLYEGDLGQATIVSDSERGNVLQIGFPAGMPGGGAPVTIIAGGGSGTGLSAGPGAPFPVRKLFLGTYVKLSSNWVDRNILTKFIYMWSSVPANENNFLGLTERGQPYLRTGVYLQTAEGSPMYMSPSSHSRGTWHKLEWYIELNTPGQSDGIARAWVDDVQVFNMTNVRWITAGHVANIDWWKLELIYGGGGLAVPEFMSVRFDDWYLKVAP